MLDLGAHLRGKRALVTGAGRGIGRSIAIALGRCGVEVAVNYRNDQAAAEETIAQLKSAGGLGWAVQADVSTGADVRRMFQIVRERFSDRIDILVNNAGSSQKAALENMPEEVWDQTMATCAKSVFLCTQQASSLLQDGSGRIINITSISARSGGGFDTMHYAAAKAAVSNFTRGCAKVFAPRGITVNGIAPGVIYTDWHKFGTPKAELDELRAKVPLGRLGEADDCVGALLLLCSPMGSYITGEIIEINGGLAMN